MCILRKREKQLKLLNSKDIFLLHDQVIFNRTLYNWQEIDQKQIAVQTRKCLMSVITAIREFRHFVEFSLLLQFTQFQQQ